MKSYFMFEKRRFENSWLDLLRTIAVALVLMRHGYRAQFDYHPPDFSIIGNIFLNGWVGVNLFFVLSGYLIATSLIRMRSQSGSMVYRNYIAQRAMRILPAYFAVLGLILIGVFPYFQVATDDILWRVFYHILLLQDYLSPNINVVFWSLGVEEKFYLLAPLIVALIFRPKLKVWFLIVVLGILTISPFLRYITYLQAPAYPIDYYDFVRIIRMPFHANLEPLIIGVALAVIMSRKYVSLRPKLARLFFAMLAVALMIGLGSHDLMSEIGMADVLWEPVIIAILFGAMVFGAIQLEHEKIFGEVFFRISARLSYTLYLVHMPLIPLCKSLSAPHGEASVIFWVYFLSFSFVAALLLHYAIEKPFLILKKNMSKSTLNLKAEPLPQTVER